MVIHRCAYVHDPCRKRSPRVQTQRSDWVTQLLRAQASGRATIGCMSQGQQDGDDISGGDARLWYSARTLADLGGLTALFLEGHISQVPGHGGPSGRETTDLIAVLTACNRAGFVTGNSQPGVPIDAYGSGQRAWVSGFASNNVLAQLRAAAVGTGLNITAARASEDNPGPFITVTLDYGEEFTWAGGGQSRSELEDHYSRLCHPDAVRAICDAWQVNIIDPEWGRNGVLWPALEKFVAK